MSLTKPDSEGQIVFIAPDGNIVLTDPSGRQRVSITNDAFIDEQQVAARIYRFPTFSTDGRFVAFVSLSTSGGAGVITSSVHVAPAVANATVITLYSTLESNIPYLDWSPDSRLIAFLTISPTIGAIRVVAREGGEVSTFDVGIPTYWHWRPDSAGMVTHLGGRATTKGKANVSIIESSGIVKGKQTVIEELPGAFQSPQWSPDGRYVLLVAYTDEQDELVLADAAGKPVCTIQTVEYNAYFAWSPDGRSVAVLDTAPSPQGILLPEKLVIHDLVNGNNSVVHDEASMFFWSPDGRKLAVYSIVFDARPTPLGSRSSNRLSAPAAQQQTAALRIEIVDAASGRRTKVADTSPSPTFTLYFPYFDQYSRIVTPWSPDSSQLVFASVSDTADLAVATLSPTGDDVSIRRIAAGVVAFWSPR
jgi:Tol biopolymer transport system component